MRIINLSNFSRYPIFGLRPTSPHLTIYRFPFPAVLSVLHRGTGIFLYFFILGIFFVESSSSLDIIDYNIYIIYNSLIQLNYVTLLLFVIPVFYSFNYHLLNGIRHYIWNTGKLLSISSVYRTGYLILFLSLILTIAEVIYLLI
uniref:Succinate dehydrogenase subunit 3 n=1 Tax=Imasa heleensis TaxID=2772037 RepID=A0A893DD03_9EUKA|nr:succinate dehydrogenase subunit 3 [Imasa heleensis]QRR29766.1 succinate dehydrogenase subunit 3 [Imasa heleensis]